MNPTAHTVIGCEVCETSTCTDELKMESATG